MKPTRLLLCLSALAGLLSLSGCLNNTPDGANSRKIVAHVTLDARDGKTKAAIPIAAELKVLLPITEGPEYEWQLAANDPRILRQRSDLKLVDDAAGKNTVMVFESLRPGKSPMRFVYVEKMKSETDAVARYEVAVTVKP